MLKSMGLPAALALAMLSMGCGPAADPPAAPAPTAPAIAPAAGNAPAAAFDATRALDMLQTRLAADHVYADAPCLQYAAETDADPVAADAAASPSPSTEYAAAAIDVAVREKHGDGCPGDPQTAPVRDRYRVERSGAILWYDVAEGDFVGYAQRARGSAGGML
ncbi:lipoprotein [Xanthomonas translucens pv. undulosa]|nr:lipoprotein [Xanthomonas translucens pv. undulosa]